MCARRRQTLETIALVGFSLTLILVGLVGMLVALHQRGATP